MTKIKSYQITDPKYFSQNPSVFKIKLSRSIFKYRSDYVVFRDKRSKNQKALIKAFLSVSKRFPKTKFLLNSNIIFAKKYRFNGIHLNSKQHRFIKPLKRYFKYIVVSTHSVNELEKCLNLGADLATISPIFYSPKKGLPKGLEILNQIGVNIKPKVVALGGIVTKEHIEQISKIGIGIFASIRYFVI